MARHSSRMGLAASPQHVALRPSVLSHLPVRAIGSYLKVARRARFLLRVASGMTKQKHFCHKRRQE